MADDTKAKIVFAGENKIGKAVDSVKKDLSSLANASDKFGSMITKAFTFTAVVAAFKNSQPLLLNASNCLIHRSRLKNLLRLFLPILVEPLHLQQRNLKIMPLLYRASLFMVMRLFLRLRRFLLQLTS